MKSDQNLMDEAEQASLEALLASLKEGPDAGLAKLEGRDDPPSVRRKLVIMLEAGRYREASDLVRGKPIQEVWCDLAIQALLLNGESEEADRIYRASKKIDDFIKREKCSLVYAQTLFARSLEAENGSKIVTPRTIDKDQHETLEQIAAQLLPLLAHIEASGKVDTSFEQEVVELSLKVAYLLGEKSRSEKLTKLLATKTPIPLLTAEAVLGGWIKETPENLAGRLRTEHPGSFEATLMSALVDGLYKGNPAGGFETVKQLIPLATTAEQRAKLYQGLEALGEGLGVEASKFIEEHAVTLLQGNEYEQNLRRASQLLNKGQLDEARELLLYIEKNKELRWLQVWAALHVKMANTIEALRSMKEAARLYPSAPLYARAAQMAFAENKLEEAAELLQEQLSLDAEDKRARLNLAFLYVQLEKYSEAAEQFFLLQRLQPEEPAHGINRAVSLEMSGDSDAALKVYEDLCATKNNVVQAFIGRAQILKAKNKPEVGFEILNKTKDLFWDDPVFVGAYMDLAHASKEDAKAHEALLRLQNLQKAGKISGLLRAASLEEIEGHFRDFQKRKEEMLKLALQGRAPWLLVEHLLGRVPYWGWASRTQQLGWLAEDPILRAEYSIYSTNFYYIKPGEDGGRFEEIEVPPKGTPVAVDLSALFTLHRLGLFHKAAEYFTKLFLPTVYMAKALAESGRLVLHQKSQKAALVGIKGLLERSKIKTINEQGGESKALPRVNEYSLPGEIGHFYRLADVAALLHSEGQISDPQLREIGQVSRQPSGVDDKHPALRRSDSVHFDLATLKTLHNLNLLEAVVSVLDIYVTQNSREEVLREVKAFETIEEVYQWHTDLWDKIRQDKRFILISRRVQAVKNADEEKSDQETWFASYQVATREKVPLFADDRVLQTIAINERKTLQFSAFGTDTMLKGLFQEKMISDVELANCYLQLIRWRYRFLIPPREVLKVFAYQFAANPPGKPLREIARYVHDCMRDSGLFAGMEATEPPATMASRMFLGWVSGIMQFLLELWQDSILTDDKAELITSWAVKELLPSPPRNLGQQQGEVIASLLPRTAMSQAFIASLNIREHERANKALRCIAENLGLDHGSYSGYFVEVINGF